MFVSFRFLVSLDLRAVTDLKYSDAHVLTDGVATPLRGDWPQMLRRTCADWWCRYTSALCRLTSNAQTHMCWLIETSCVFATPTVSVFSLEHKIPDWHTSRTRSLATYHSSFSRLTHLQNKISCGQSQIGFQTDTPPDQDLLRPITARIPDWHTSRTRSPASNHSSDYKHIFREMKMNYGDRFTILRQKLLPILSVSVDVIDGGKPRIFGHCSDGARRFNVGFLFHRLMWNEIRGTKIIRFELELISTYV